MKLCLALLCVPVLLGATSPVAYRVTYGGQDLGTWTTMQVRQAAKGTYDGSSFDSDSGPGFPEIILTRALVTADRQSLWKSLPPGNRALAITASQNGAPAGTTTCE